MGAVFLTQGEVFSTESGSVLYCPVDKSTLAFAKSSSADGVLVTRAEFACNQFQALEEQTEE